MAEKGVVVEFDFAVLDGAKLLFETAKGFLEGLDKIALDKVLEARYLAGSGYLDGLTRLFAFVKTKKTPQKAARELSAAFCAAVTAALPKAAAGVSFRNFVKALSDRGVHVVISTRADPAVAQQALEPLVGENVSIYQEVSDLYGSVRWDAWRRACMSAKLRHMSTLAITGSGSGVKSALVAGMGSVAVANDHVAYQDFGGASDVVGDLSGKTAKKVLHVLGLDA